MSVIAGVDVGGSGIRAVVRTSDVERRGAVERAVHLGSSINPETVAGGIADLLGELGTHAVDVLCVGMTGFPGLLNDPEVIARRLRDSTGSATVLIASDALTTHVGALAMESGIVVAAGTGVIALGTDHHTRWNRVDGWGHLLGDDGSGAWIGRAGITAGLRAQDGRGGSEPLLRAILTQYSDLATLLDSIYASGTPAYELARFAPVVADVARSGDPVARSIYREAASRLADTAIAAADGIDPVFSWGGGLLIGNQPLREQFTRAIVERLPDAVIREPVGGSLEGALQLADRFGTVGAGDASEYLYASSATG